MKLTTTIRVMRLRGFRVGRLRSRLARLIEAEDATYREWV